MKGNKLDRKLIKVGQLWHYTDVIFNIVIEVMTASSDTWRCKVVQYTAGSITMGHEDGWSFNNPDADYTYLEGQDRPTS